MPEPDPTAPLDPTPSLDATPPLDPTGAPPAATGAPRAASAVAEAAFARPAGHTAPSSPRDRLVDATAGRLAAAAFAAVARLRHRRALHPAGVAFEAVLHVTPSGPPLGAPLLDAPARHPAVVRFSRGGGLPAPLPDALGIAVRVPDAGGVGHHQDLLLTSAGQHGPARHLVVPALDHVGPRHTSLAPHRIGGRHLLLGARVEAGPGARAVDRDGLVALAATGELRVVLDVAATREPWRRVAVLEVGAPLALPDAAVRFDPYVTTEGIEPVGVVNALRRRAYRASQGAGRPAPTPVVTPGSA